MRICTLKYRLPDSSPVSSDGEPILLAVLKDNSLQLLVHRDLKRLVAKQDQLYMDELLGDLIRRSKDSPRDVFRQLSKLSVGPVFAETERSLEPGPGGLNQLFPDFLPALVSDFPEKGDESSGRASRRS